MDPGASMFLAEGGPSIYHPDWLTAMGQGQGQGRWWVVGRHRGKVGRSDTFFFLIQDGNIMSQCGTNILFWTNEYPNIFITIDIGRMNIQIYSAYYKDHK